MRIVSALTCITLAAIAALTPQKAKAWGEFGHLTVCDLAYRNLTPASKQSLKTLFNAQGGGISIPASAGNDARHYTSFNVGCLEEDSRPKKHPKDHFINVDRSLPAVINNICPLSPVSGQPLQCIFEGIDRDMLILKDVARSRQQRVIALMAIGHWVGDLHQPLHISYADDVGANNITVSYQGKCGFSSGGNAYRPKNLHSVWDNCLLENGLFQRVRERADFRPTWSRRTITYRAVDTLLIRTKLADEIALVSTAPWQWAAESYAITRKPEVKYCTMVNSVCQFSATQAKYVEGGEARKELIGPAYLNAFKDDAEDRVRKAGFRLAHLINLALDPAYTQPIQNSGQTG
jgi:S1/P1 Nuclease